MTDHDEKSLSSRGSGERPRLSGLVPELVAARACRHSSSPEVVVWRLQEDGDVLDSRPGDVPLTAAGAAEASRLAAASLASCEDADLRHHGDEA